MLDRPLTLDVDLSPEAASVRTARADLQVVMRGVPMRPRELATLALSELVSNAVEHAGGALHVRARAFARSLRVEVLDGSTAPPELQPDDPFSLRGRGLRIVDKVVSRWGSLPSPTGKAVWFELEW